MGHDIGFGKTCYPDGNSVLSKKCALEIRPEYALAGAYSDQNSSAE
jgi:hypothetical protein